MKKRRWTAWRLWSTADLTIDKREIVFLVGFSDPFDEGRREHEAMAIAGTEVGACGAHAVFSYRENGGATFCGVAIKDVVWQT